MNALANWLRLRLRGWLGIQHQAERLNSFGQALVDLREDVVRLAEAKRSEDVEP